MTFQFKFNGTVYAVVVKGEKPPSQVVLPDKQVLKMEWTGAPDFQAYDIDPVPHDKTEKKPWEISDLFNVPMAMSLAS